MGVGVGGHMCCGVGILLVTGGHLVWWLWGFELVFWLGWLGWKKSIRELITYVLTKLVKSTTYACLFCYFFEHFKHVFKLEFS